MVQALNRAMAQEMERDPEVVILGEDVGIDGGVFRITDGLVDKFGPERVIDTPLAESAIVGTAIGMAAYGLKPVAEIQFMGFVYQAFHQILDHAARMRNRTRGRFTLPLVMRMPYGAGVRALELHSESTEAIFCQLPGLYVVVPSTPLDAQALMTSSIRCEDPVIFLEPKRLYRAGKQEIPEDLEEIPLSQAKIAREGEDLTIVAWGAMVPVVQAAAEEVEKSGVFPEIIDLRTLSPMDFPTVQASVEKTGRAMIVHEAPKNCGLGGEIAARIGEKTLLKLDAPVMRVTGQDITVPLAKSEDFYYPTPQRVVYSINKLMEW
ncbi:MAG: alpha-ketoacid dehydrogenase subunit beta [Candidatus Aminicenantes bacterium]|nr:alpha-ketoacid dehydrogenase subunit beta [Candidatus Aminicenantes bacterium]